MKNFFQKPWIFTFGLVLAMIFWGMSWISAKFLALQADPFLLSFWRFLGVSLGAGLFLLFVKKKKTVQEEKTPSSLKSFYWMLFAALAMSLYNIIFFWGLQNFPSGRAGVLVTTTNPLFAFLLGRLIGGDRPSLGQLLGLGLGLIGGLLQLRLGSPLEPTALWYLASALLWAILTLASNKARPGYGLLSYTFWVYFISSVSLALLLVFTGRNLWPGLSLTFWLNVGFLAWPAGLFATGLYFEASRRLGTSKSGSLTFMVPVVAMVLSWIIFGEKPLMTTLIGGSISLLAVFIIQSSGKEKGSVVPNDSKV